MPELLFMLIGSVLVNVLTVQGLLNLDRRVSGPRGYEAARALVMSTVPAALASSVVAQGLLIWVLQPLEAGYLYLLLLVAASVGATSLMQLVLRRTAVAASGATRLIAANSLVIAAMADAAARDRGFAYVFLFACLFAAGFALLVLAMTELAGRLDEADAPGPFKGVPLLFVSAGVAALALLGLGGLLPV